MLKTHRLKCTSYIEWTGETLNAISVDQTCLQEYFSFDCLISFEKYDVEECKTCLTNWCMVGRKYFGLLVLNRISCNRELQTFSVVVFLKNMKWKNITDWFGLCSEHMECLKQT